MRVATALGDADHYLHPRFIDKSPEAFEDNHGGLPKRSWRARCRGGPGPCLEGWWELAGGVVVVGSTERWPFLCQGAVAGHALGGVSLAPQRLPGCTSL